LPPEEEDRCDGEDEAECDTSCVHPLDRHREALRKHHPREQRGERGRVFGRVSRVRVREARRDDRDEPREAHGGDDREQSR
jgi:hypothetical protein